MVSVPPWKRMRVGSCLVRGEVLTLYLWWEGERPRVTLRQLEGGWGAPRDSAPAQALLPRSSRPRPGADVRVPANVHLPKVQPRAVVPGEDGDKWLQVPWVTAEAGHEPWPCDSLRPPAGTAHLRERSAKIGAKDWHSLDQLAKNSTIQVTRLSRSSSSCREGGGLSGGRGAEPPGTSRGRGYSHLWSCR